MTLNDMMNVDLNPLAYFSSTDIDALAAVGTGALQVAVVGAALIFVLVGGLLVLLAFIKIVAAVIVFVIRRLPESRRMREARIINAPEAAKYAARAARAAARIEPPLTR